MPTLAGHQQKTRFYPSGCLDYLLGILKSPESPMNMVCELKCGYIFGVDLFSFRTKLI